MNRQRRTRGAIAVARAIAAETSDRDVTFLAASIAYYAFVSLVPLLVLAAVVVIFLGGEGTEAVVLAYVLERFPTGEEFVRPAFESQRITGGVGIASLALTVWGSLKIFRALDVAFSRVYGSETGGLVDQIADGLTVLVAIGVGVAGVGLVAAAIALADLPFAGLLSSLALLATLCVAFFPFYYVLPDVGVGVREVVPGTVFAAVGWTLLGTVFGVYAAVAGANAATAIAGVLLLLTWFYFSGIVLLVGAVLNAVLGGRLIDRQLQQGSARQHATTEMSETDTSQAPEVGSPGDRRDAGVEPRGAADVNELEERIAELRADLDAFEDDVEDRTVEKPELERELKQYVRSRMRRGHARGWGPYLVLLYGTVMTLGAFYFLENWAAVAAMFVVFTSTLGLYLLFVLVGVAFNLTGLPGRAIGAVRKRRE